MLNFMVHLLAPMWISFLFTVLIVATPLVFVWAIFGHHLWELYVGGREGEVYGIGVVFILVDLLFIWITIEPFSKLYGKLYHIIEESDFELWFMIGLDSILTFFLESEEDKLDSIQICVLCISLYLICCVRFANSELNTSLITHLLFEVYFTIAIQHLLEQHLCCSLACGLVVLASSLMKVPSILPRQASAPADSDDYDRRTVLKYQRRRRIPVQFRAEMQHVLGW